jgi:hypothetical protein
VNFKTKISKKFLFTQACSTKHINEGTIISDYSCKPLGAVWFGVNSLGSGTTSIMKWSSFLFFNMDFRKKKKNTAITHTFMIYRT